MLRVFAENQKIQRDHHDAERKVPDAATDQQRDVEHAEGDGSDFERVHSTKPRPVGAERALRVAGGVGVGLSGRRPMTREPTPL